MKQEFKRFVIMSQDILEDPDLSVGEKLLLARYSGFKGEIFESPAETGKFLKMSAVTIKRHRSNLEKKGYIKCISNNGHGKKYVVAGDKITGEVYQIDTPGVSNCYTENKIKNKEIPKGISVAQQPEAASQTSRKKSEFNILIENLCSLLSIDVSKINWAAARRWYNEGRNSNCSDEDFIKAAKAMKKVCDEGRITPSIHKVLTNTSYWLSAYAPEKPKGVW